MLRRLDHIKENAPQTADNSHFLRRKPPHLRKTRPAEKSSPEIAPHLRDIQELSRTELRKKYQPEYTCWRNMKQRAPDQVAEEYMEFRGFLGDLGRRPSPEFTLDRIDNDNPRYGPGLCRWADKREQANNRRTTIKLIYQGTKYPEFFGQEHPRTQWARMTGQKPDTLRKRMEAGWAHTEAIDGERAPEGELFQWPTENVDTHQKWEQSFLASRYEDRLLFLRDTLRGMRDECRAEIERAEIEIERQHYLGPPGPGCEEVPFDENDLIPFEERLGRILAKLEETETLLTNKATEERQAQKSKIEKSLRTLSRFGNPSLEKRRKGSFRRMENVDEDDEGDPLEDGGYDE